MAEIHLDKKSLTDNIEDEIFNISSELTIDYSEIALDALTKEIIISEIPIVKSLVSFYKISSSIVDRYNVKKILIFLKEFHLNNIDPDQLKKFKEKLNKNEKHRVHVLETILMLNEKFIDIKKSQILANLFSAHIDEIITWDEFFKMSFIITNLNPSGYQFLEALVDKESKTRINMIQYIEGQALLIACGIAAKFEDKFKVTATGVKLYEIGIKPLKKNYTL